MDMMVPSPEKWGISAPDPTSRISRTYLPYHVVQGFNKQIFEVALEFDLELSSLYAAKSQLPNSLGWSIRLAAPDLRPIRAAVRAVTSP